MAITAASLTVDVTADTSDAESKLGKLGGSISDGLGKAAKIGATALAGVSIAAVGVGIDGVKAFAGFQKQMNEVFTLLPGISGDAMSAMSGQVKDFSKEFGVLPEKVVPALYQAISAGIPQANVFTFLEVAQKAAAGGVTDLTTAVDGISSVINAYGTDVLSAGKASDDMFTAVKLGKTNFEELSKSLFNVVPTASALGVSFDDVTAALAAMTVQGVPTSVATTQLRQAFVELSKEGGTTSATFQDIAGKSFKDFIAGGGNVSQALNLMAQRAADTGVNVNDLFTSVEAGSAALALTGKGAATFAADIAAMGGNAGATDAAFQTMQKSVSANLDKIKARIAVLRIEIGEKLLPVVSALLGFAIAKLLPAVERLGQRISGPLTSAFKVARDGVLTFADAIQGKWTDDTRILGIHRAIGKIGTVIHDQIIPAITTMAGFFTDTLLPAGEKAFGAILGLVEDIAKGDWSSAGQTILDGITAALSGLVGLGTGLVTSIANSFTGVDWSGVAGTVASGIATAWGTLTSAAGAVITWITTGFTSIQWTALAMSIASGIATAWGVLTDAGVAVYNWIVGSLTSVNWTALASNIASGIGTAWSLLTDGATYVYNWIASGLSGLDWSTLATSIKGYIASGIAAGGELVNAITTALTQGDPSGAVFYSTGYGIGFTAGTGVGQGLADGQPKDDGFWATYKANASTNLAAVGAAFADMGTGISDASSGIGDVLSALGPEFEGIAGAAVGVAMAVEQFSKALGPTLQIVVATVSDGLSLLGDAGHIAADGIRFFNGAVADTVRDSISLFTDLYNGGKAAYDGLNAVIDVAIDQVVAFPGYVSSATSAVVGFFSGMASDVGSIVSGFVSAVTTGGGDALSGITGALSSLPSAVGGLFTSMASGVTSIIGGLVSQMAGLGNDIISSLSGGIAGALGGLFDLVGGIPSGIVSAVSGIDLSGIGAAIVQGLIDGINSMIGPLESALSFITSKIPDWKGPASTDATLLHESGRLIMQGLMNGIASQLAPLETQLTVIGNRIRDAGLEHGHIYGSRVREGALEELANLGPEIVAQLMALVPTLGDAGSALVKPILDAVANGSLRMRDAANLFTAPMVEALQRLEEQLTVQLAEALITGTDPTAIEAQLATIDALLTATTGVLEDAAAAATDLGTAATGAAGQIQAVGEAADTANGYLAAMGGYLSDAAMQMGNVASGATSLQDALNGMGSQGPTGGKPGTPAGSGSSGGGGGGSNALAAGGSVKGDGNLGWVSQYNWSSAGTTLGRALQAQLANPAAVQGMIIDLQHWITDAVDGAWSQAGSPFDANHDMIASADEVAAANRTLAMVMEHASAQIAAAGSFLDPAKYTDTIPSITQMASDLWAALSDMKDGAASAAGTLQLLDLNANGLIDDAEVARAKEVFAGLMDKLVAAGVDVSRWSDAVVAATPFVGVPAMVQQANQLQAALADIADGLIDSASTFSTLDTNLNNIIDPSELTNAKTQFDALVKSLAAAGYNTAAYLPAQTGAMGATTCPSTPVHLYLTPDQSTPIATWIGDEQASLALSNAGLRGF